MFISISKLDPHDELLELLELELLDDELELLELLDDELNELELLELQEHELLEKLNELLDDELIELELLDELYPNIGSSVHPVFLI